MAFDVTASHQGTVFTDHQAVSAGPIASGPFLTLSFDGSERVAIDALLVRSNRIIFSTDVDFRMGSTNYADEDLIAYTVTSGVYSMYFDGSALGIPRAADLDAASLQFGTTNLLLSFDMTFTLAGAGTVDDDDIIRFAAGAFTKAYDGQTNLGISAAADLDALYADATHLYYSLDISARNGILNGTDKDVWRVATNTLTTSLMGDFGLEDRADLAALEDLTDTDGDGLSDIEEITGLDEAGTTYPGTGAPLSPGGLTSNPGNADSDGDTVSDGHEAAAGTSPTNGLDFLRVTSIEFTAGAPVVTWASVSGKTYDLETTSLLGGFTNIVANDVPAAGSSTTVTNAGPVDARFYRVSVQP
jgi:hypothetical protein